MASEPQVLALIPARGGSKSIPMKNIALLAGRSAFQRRLVELEQLFLDHPTH